MLYPTLWNGLSSGLWEDLFNVRRGFNRLFDRYVGTAGDDTRTVAWTPAFQVREAAEHLELMVELPGVRPEDVTLTVERGVLTVSGEKRREIQEGETDGTYYCSERAFGRFQRSFTLPSTVDTDHVQANFVNGVLTVILPKVAEAKPRRIPIQAGQGTARIGAGTQAA